MAKLKNKTFSDDFFMGEALKEAKKAFLLNEVPVGVVITQNNTIIAKSYNQIQKKHNTCFHAEFLAIQKVIKKLRLKHLLNNQEPFTLYTTLEPCPMCAGAIVLAKIHRVVIGAKDEKSGSAGSAINILQNEKFNHFCDVTFGVKSKDCSEILTSFFAQKRIEKKNKKIT